MLNPPHEKVTVEAFKEFLATNPADETFDYIDGKECGFAQFAQTLDIGFKSCCPSSYCTIDGEWHEIPHVIDRALLYAAQVADSSDAVPFSAVAVELAKLEAV